MRRGVLALTLSLVAGFGLTLLPAADDPTASNIAIINKVGPEGAGSTEAAAAFKALAKGGPETLIPILKSLREEAPRAANWLRPAFEAVAERAIAAGKLPKADLVAFLEDIKNDRSARRIAYEWLTKVDADTPKVYLPKMLKDPSPELRRDAVQVVIDEADQLLKSDKALAKAAYLKALTGACDPDQVDAIAAALKKLDVKIDQQKHFGVVARWHLAAPFDHAKRGGWDVVYPPEKGVDLKATYEGKDGEKVTWQPVTTTDPQGLVDINKAIKQYKGAICYAFATVESPVEQDVEFRAGSINALKIFLNGKLIFAREEYHHGSSIDQYIAKGRLKAGTNEILFKVCQNEQKESWAQRWTYMLRLTDSIGAAAPFSQKEAK